MKLTAPLHGRIKKILFLSVVIAGGCESSRADPSSVTNELKDAYLDIGTLERAVACEDNSQKLENFLASKPFVVEGGDYSCSVVAKGTSVPNQQRSAHGDFVLKNGKCDELRSELSTDIERHENFLKNAKDLFCGPDGSPVAEVDDAVRIATGIRLEANVPKVLRRRLESMQVSQRPPSNMADCYAQMTKELSLAISDKWQLQCSLLSREWGANSPSTTFRTIFDRGDLSGELAAFTERHKKEFDTAVEQDQMPKFWSDFLTEYKALACSDTSTLTWDARLEIARSAANACMIPL